MTQTPYSVIMNLPSSGSIVKALYAGDVSAVESFLMLATTYLAEATQSTMEQLRMAS